MPPPPDMLSNAAVVVDEFGAGGSSAPVPLYICVFMGILLSSTSWIMASKWRVGYPLEMLEDKVQSIAGLINDNSTVEQDLLLEHGPVFRRTLRRINVFIQEIKTNEYNKPVGILNIPAQIMFWFSQARQTRSCYLQLCQLEHGVEACIQAVKEAQTRALLEVTVI
ncbi:hypothetical protein L218DRAFT_333085 [Marasmius fiardii PR-910]|nr:hypothetical protein L218DRAFT_333085 [Marasmius fiardii PR-910]